MLVDDRAHIMGLQRDPARLESDSRHGRGVHFPPEGDFTFNALVDRTMVSAMDPHIAQGRFETAAVEPAGG